MSEWRELGMVTTGNGTLAIVAPHFARTLGDEWQERLRRDGELIEYPFEEVRLEQRTVRHDLVDYDDSEECILFDTQSYGSFRVLGRFEDVYEDGRPVLVELRALLWEDEDHDGAVAVA